ncbi:hypothetical protein DITRI_Ditri12bG0148200 [Diplodiscus trichospermus]
MKNCVMIITDFVASVGLPEGRVPSMKELSQHRRIFSHVNFRGKSCKFVQNGDLGAIQYNVYGMLSESGDQEIKEVVGTSNEVAMQCRCNSHECSEHAYGAAITVNGSTTVTKRLLLLRHHDNMGAQMLKGADLREDLNSENTGRDDQIEINYLKFMLVYDFKHQKELELTRLKEQIEKEKIALSALQTMAETEIHRAQKLVSEKDAELHAAEESLSGLEEIVVPSSRLLWHPMSVGIEKLTACIEEGSLCHAHP